MNIQQSQPSAILQYATDAVRVQADQKKVALKINLESDLPTVKADKDKTAWVLINFLTNAIRYSPDNAEVTIEIFKQEEKVIFSVKDNGKGIEAKYLSKLFDRYFQVPGTFKTGTGLGLAISKEFIEAQGGTIHVESKIAVGSTFYFKLLV